MHPILILTVDLTLSKRRKRIEEVTAGWTDIWTKEQKDDTSVFVKVAQKLFYEGGTNVIF
jgi:hypothetical protein